MGIKACYNIAHSQKAQIKILEGPRRETRSWKFSMKSWDLSIINIEYEQWKVHKETISFFPAGDSLGWAAGESLNNIDAWNEECALTLRGTVGTRKNGLERLLL